MDEKKHADRKYRGGSRIHEFACGHVGFGKFCHLCAQVETGEMIKEDGKIVPNPSHITYRQMVDFVKEEYPHESFTGMNKGEIVDFYLRQKSFTLAKLKEKMGDPGVARLKKHFRGR